MVHLCRLVLRLRLLILLLGILWRILLRMILRSEPSRSRRFCNILLPTTNCTHWSIHLLLLGIVRLLLLLHNCHLRDMLLWNVLVYYGSFFFGNLHLQLFEQFVLVLVHAFAHCHFVQEVVSLSLLSLNLSLIENDVVELLVHHLVRFHVLIGLAHSMSHRSIYRCHLNIVHLP